ncbi:1518_t:CDS:2 [Entrophospora sp. SA101]|nr:9714_t:CDS:2 [Entrophospora sp. SA101]CAJ0760219.1 1518_t:CDS:2 [Entrophospora sp. SA101]CAJ0859619.1 10275_t:CDS:2 [Entrophospora sp. SA101]
MAKEQGGVLSGHNPASYNAGEPITLFIIQVTPLRQPRVIAEVVGGILLGPSVMGRIPGFQQAIFPSESIPLLNLLANIGLVLFLFIVGVELNPKILIKYGRTSATISIAGILLPFAFGVGVGYGLYTQLSDQSVPFSSYLLFIGVAMSITAFPVLARILTELNLLKTVAGLTAFSAGVVDDVAAWILLALVVTIINSSNMLTALYILLLAIAWVLIVVFAVRPLLLFFIHKTGSNDNGPTLTMTAITLLTVLTSAFVTNIIGIHAIFGGFVIGVIMPHEGGFAVGITEKIEDLVNVLFLPIYFALSGLKTQIGLLSDPNAFGWVILVTVVAVFCKISGCTLAARLNKLTWRESLTVGVFMSFIDAKVFVIMVIMALITTFATTPLAIWIYPHKYQRKFEHKPETNNKLGDVDEKEVTGHSAYSSSKAKKDKNLLVVLDKVEFLPAMMTLIQLLQTSSSLYPALSTISTTDPQPTSSTRDSTATTTTTTVTTLAKNSDSVTDKATVAVDKKRKNSASSSSDGNSSGSLTVHVLRLVELTQRISTVIKFSESEETILHDPIMNVFRTFGKLNFVNVKPNLAIVSRQDFAQQIADSASENHADSVIVPWGGAGAVIEDPSNMFEEMIGSHKNKSTSPQVSNYIQGAFNLLSEQANVFVFVDRGLGFSRQKTSKDLPASTSGGFVKIFLPFFGGKDDREALKFVVKLVKNPNVEVEVMIIIKSNEPTDNDAVLETNLALHEGEEEPEGSVKPPLTHKVSIASTVLSGGEGHESKKLDDELIEKYKKQKSSNSRIRYTDVLSATPLQTAVEKAKKIVERKDLVVIGRGRYSSGALNHRAEFLEVIKNIGGSYGDETRKSLGDVAESFLFGGVSSSILVVQSKKTSKTVNTNNEDDIITESRVVDIV